MVDASNQSRTEARWAGLMRAGLAGDDAAYRTLLDELSRAFRVAARARLARFGRGNADVEDIVQDALIAIHLKRDTWDQARPFSAWAQAVLSHKIADRMRRQSVRMHEDLESIVDQVPATETDPSTATDLQQMLGHLEDRARRIVTAISIEGRSAADVAQETGATEGAIRVALHRALARLAVLFRESGS